MHWTNRRWLPSVRHVAVDTRTRPPAAVRPKTSSVALKMLMAVTGILPQGKATEAEVLAAGALCSQEADQDPIDRAFLAAARERSLLGGQAPFKALSFTPFDAKTRCTEALVEQQGQRWRLMKGRST